MDRYPALYRARPWGRGAGEVLRLLSYCQLQQEPDICIIDTCIIDTRMINHRNMHHMCMHHHA